MFTVIPKRNIKSKGMPLTTEMEVTITTRKSVESPFYNEAKEVKEAYMSKYNFDYEEAGCSADDFTFKALFSFKEVDPSVFKDSNFELPILLGKDTEGNNLVADLTEAIHILAGSVLGDEITAFNNMIVSLLLSKTSEELKLLLIDPYKYKFDEYKRLHKGYQTPFAPIVIQDMTEIESALESLEMEMDTRFDKLREAESRNIIAYNNKAEEKMPYLVVVIVGYNECATAIGDKFMRSIIHIAQLASTVGIHIVMSTCRITPSIVTGTIKANFPSRLAFRLTTKYDSLTLLDCSGAENLDVEGGNALWIGFHSSDTKELDVPVITKEDIRSVIDFLSANK